MHLFKQEINRFCEQNLALQLHPDKSKVLELGNGVGFLGFRLYAHHRRIKKKNVRRFERKMIRQRTLFTQEKISREKVVESFEGWLAHVSRANTFKYRKHLVRTFNVFFPLGEPILKHNLTKHQNFLKKSEEAQLRFSVQQTKLLFGKGETIEEIAKMRNIKTNTVWDHLANLIEYNQLSVWKILPHDKVKKILLAIDSEKDMLKTIQERLKDNSIEYNEINCVLAYVKSKNRIKNVLYHVNWYRKNHCLRKCYFNSKQRKICFGKLDTFSTHNTNLAMKREQFLDFFNNHLNICVLPEKEKRALE